MTSYQAQCDQLLSSGKATGVAIINAIDGNTFVFGGSRFNLKDGEGGAIVSQFRYPKIALANGVIVNGIRYTAYKADSRSFYTRNGATGVALARAWKSIVIVFYNETISGPNAIFACEGAADALGKNRL
ncbi:hypothetical protein DICPUDRAFT_157061 [Dictyostelium purpureum]|uniref:Profilin n=1 Tax=Dictyostelium purpureum TaxID=5786 RepID=F0ZY60_DICPU|nr:uncharacterized protein DICPUDRAFT_157061 [Dictyostelium purpureum]EGC31129.1 hypothetical protein DICPUDRAFT_157061 [Dictyostelium purpureum]|eukprot:XP_003292347.1 hypothetical protein DICPUDRAFT_157061 [Dictyostelium purpureum]